MSSGLAPMPKSKAEELYREATKILANAKLEQSRWEYVGSTSYGGSISTPIFEIGMGYTLTILQVKEQIDVNTSTTHSFGLQSFDAGAGIGAVPFNVTFPLPNAPSTGKILQMPNTGTITMSSFKGLFYSFAQSGQLFGMNGSISFTFFIPKVSPNLNIFNPGVIWTAGVIIAAAGSGGGMSPGDIGMTWSVGFAV